MLTKKQKQEYCKNPVFCPYCGSSDIIAGSVDWDISTTQQISCGNCDKIWYDIFKVVDITEDDDFD